MLYTISDAGNLIAGNQDAITTLGGMKGQSPITPEYTFGGMKYFIYICSPLFEIQMATS